MVLSVPVGPVRALTIAALAAVGLTLSAVWAPAASAHATVSSSTPADGQRLAQAPSEVSITFDEGVGLSTGYLRVISADGVDVTAGAAAHPGGRQEVIAVPLRAGLPDSAYVASWSVVSADSHPVQGTIRFVVGSGPLTGATTAPVGGAPAANRIAFTVVRAAGYLALCLTCGVWLLWALWPAGRRVRRAHRMFYAGWVLAVVSTAAEIVVQGAETVAGGALEGLRISVLAGTLTSSYGILHLLRLLLLAALAAIVDFAWAGARVDPSPVRLPRRPFTAAAAVFVGVVFTYTYSGHAAAAAPSWLAVSSDMLHLTSAAVWVGGLAYLAAVLLPHAETDETAVVLPVFSTVATVSVAVIAATGTYQGWRESGTIAALTSTTYGLLVVGKAVLFAGLLLLGNLSRRTIQHRYAPRRRTTARPAGTGLAGIGPAGTGPAGAAPTVDDGPGPSDGPRDAGLRKMRRSVAIEVAVAVVVLGLTSVLVAQPPGRTAVVTPTAPPVSASADLGGGRELTITVSPGQHGVVAVDATITGPPVTAAPTVTMTAALAAQQLGPLPVPLEPVGAPLKPAFHADGQLLTFPGDWIFAVTVRTSEFDSTTATIPIHLQ